MYTVGYSSFSVTPLDRARAQYERGVDTHQMMSVVVLDMRKPEFRVLDAGQAGTGHPPLSPRFVVAGMWC